MAETDKRPKPEAHASYAAMMAALRADGRTADGMTPDDAAKVFVEHQRIEAAVEAHRLAIVRKGEAESEHRQQEAAGTAARTQYNRCLAGESAESPTEGKLALDAAELALTVARDVLTTRTNAAAAADRAIGEARGLANRPLMIEGMRRRLRAVRLADKARADLAHAESEWDTANAIINRAKNAGAPWMLASLGDGMGGPPWTMPDEMARWNGSSPATWFDLTALVKETRE